jgi:hypothetical protein
MPIAPQPQAEHSPQHVSDVVVRGNTRTRTSTVLGLFPRHPPAAYSDVELDECARRLANLEIFDSVSVVRDGDRVVVTVREKWTLLPTFDFASGATANDLYALVGVTEYNLFGTGTELTVALSRAQRGFGVSLEVEEHSYRRRRWSFSGETSFAESEYRFEDGSGWSTRAFEGGLYMNSPPVVSQHFNTRVGMAYGREDVLRARADAPPLDSHALYVVLGFVWDRYNWHDLVPRGLRLLMYAGTGLLTAPGVTQPRDFLELRGEYALALSSSTVLAARGLAGMLTRGNPNYSYLIGSIEGVRGLSDAYYRTWAASYLNTELRQSLRLAPRWALQGIAFVDVAAFSTMNERGARGPAELACSLGLGARLVPTWLASTVLRVDGARLFEPDQRWFIQLGLNQYF